MRVLRRHSVPRGSLSAALSYWGQLTPRGSVPHFSLFTESEAKPGPGRLSLYFRRGTLPPAELFFLHSLFILVSVPHQQLS